MIRNIFNSTTTTLVSILTFITSTNVMAVEKPSGLETPKLNISGSSSFNSWFFNNDRKLLRKAKDGSPCGFQRFGRGQLFSVDDPRLRFSVDGKLDSGMEYGLVFVLEPSVNATKNARENFLFFGGSWGKVIVGDTNGVLSTMTFGGYDQWGGTGFINGGDFDRVVNYTTGVVHSVNLIGDTSRDTKATYITPRWNGLQAGISYVPRTEHRGEDDINSITSTSSPKKPFDTDNISNAINFIHKFCNGFEMALSASSVFAARTHAEFSGAVHRRKTFGYAFGGTFSYENIGFSAEYGNNNRSREFKNHRVNAGEFADFGISYTWGATKFSTGYYYSWRKSLALNNSTRKAKLSAVSAAVDQKLAPGLGVYIEYAFFDMKNPGARSEAKRLNKNNTCDFVGGVPSNKANVFVIGSRLVF
ncbi:MAG: porin [Alphaproteobacteria bacterium]|nr:porin [Alphaproteobacteria bacterium]